MTNAAIYYHADAYRTDRAKLMGRHAAGEGFLRGFMRHADIERVVCFTETEAGFAEFKAACAAAGGRNARLPFAWAGTLGSDALKGAGALFLPGPNLEQHAWTRRRRDPRAFSLCGITHTTASHGAMDAIGALITAPVQEWDALICTSRAVRRTVERLLESQRDYLADRLGTKGCNPPLPQLPVIPLGVDTDHLAPDRPEAAQARQAWRARLGIPDDGFAVLFVGRLSFHAKAHPLPLFVGLEDAARETGLRPHLILSGWAANDAIAAAFRDAARALAPSVAVSFVDGRTTEARNGIWFAADCFCSPSDNIQETFGLTPIEAMAAGLPVVVTDWDGYRDTVPHEEAGFRVPTIMPEAGAGTDLADAHADGSLTYDRYCGVASLATAVDIRAVRRAFTALMRDRDQARSMGETARKHARAAYDWKVVIRAYQDLWRDLAERRRAAAESAPRGAGPSAPLRDDPFRVFDGYATAPLSPGLRLRRANRDGDYVQAVSRLEMNVYGRPTVGPSPVAQHLYSRLAGLGEATVGELVASCAPADQQRARLALGWLLKTGLAETVEEAAPLSAT